MFSLKSISKGSYQRGRSNLINFKSNYSDPFDTSIVAGKRLTALQNGNEIFPAMLRAIRSAQSSITFETFIYWSGEIGQEFSEAVSYYLIGENYGRWLVKRWRCSGSD